MGKRNTIFQTYRILPLVLTGCLVLAALTLITVLIWTLIAYFGHLDPTIAGGVASTIHLLLVFFSCAIITWLIRGGTVFPAVILSLLAAIATFFLSDHAIRFGPAFGKILLTLIAGIAGFSIAKLLYPLYKRTRKKKTKHSLFKRIHFPRKANQTSQSMPKGESTSGMRERI